MTDEPPVKFPNVGRVHELDGLRGLAVLMVVVFHYSLFFKPASGSAAAYITRVLGFGWSGVDLFFVLSGFLIGGILVDQRESRAYFKTFYVRRICRIFPVYYLLILCYGLMIALQAEYLAPTLFNPDRQPVWEYALYVQNIGTAVRNAMDSPFVLVTWSLAIEEQFYFLLPFVVRFFPVRALLWIYAIFVVSSPLLRTWIVGNATGPTYAAFVLLPCRWDALFMGAACAILVRKPRVAQALGNHPRRLLAALLALGLGVATLIAWNPNSLSPHMATFGYTWIGLFYVCLLLVVIHVPYRPVRRLARSRWLRRLSDISYATYLFHFPIAIGAHWLVFDTAPSIHNAATLSVSLGAIAVTIGLAWLSTNTFERFFINIGQRYRYAPPLDRSQDSTIK